MIATLPFIQKTFDRFNALCFEGKLPSVPIILTKAGTFLGKMEYKTRRDFFGFKISHYGFRLKISIGFDLPEDVMEDVVLHEMIHYYIAFCGIRDSSAHGNAFRRIMETVNRQYGRHVSVSHRGPQEQNLVRGENSEFKKHYICVSTFVDGNVGVTVCASNKITDINRLLPRCYKLKNMEWYVSLDSFFNRFPRSRTPKIYRITADELSERLKDAEKVWKLAVPK
ncbi:MAG: SprT-like domain-containing protein [Alistipes sp.]|nr:SprT-like domain-containing protein [Candidatus Minthomonas equi]